MQTEFNQKTSVKTLLLYSLRLESKDVIEFTDSVNQLNV